MDFSLSIEHRMLQESVQEFLKKECPVEKVRELDERDEFPIEIFNKMKPLGFSGLTIAEEYGGYRERHFWRNHCSRRIIKKVSCFGMVICDERFLWWSKYRP